MKDVRAVLYGDFLGCGKRQALFLPCGSVSVADILDVVDAEMDTARSDADSFGRQFLLTDFSQVNIDRWRTTTVLFVDVIILIFFVFTSLAFFL